MSLTDNDEPTIAEWLKELEERIGWRNVPYLTFGMLMTAYESAKAKKPTRKELRTFSSGGSCHE